MKVIRKTLLTAAVLVFGIAFCLLFAVLVLAACSEKVTLRFETYGGTYLESVEGKVGTAYTVPSEPQKEGYYFEGWYLSSDFSGSPQTLPDSMPDESRTYYAKYARYPVLTLQPEGGTVKKTTHLIKPGVNLVSYLSEFEPQKKGLRFGGWYVGDEKLESDRSMTQADLTLTARYLADFSVKVYLQNADEPETFSLSEELSEMGSNWEGETLLPEFTPPEHFLLDESKSSAQSKTLGAGENVLEYYYLRKSVNLTYSLLLANGERRETVEQTRYGANITLPQNLAESESRAFFGWSHSESAPASYLPGENMTMGYEDAVLYGTWGKIYSNARGEGNLIVEEIKDGFKQQAIFSTASATERGIFDSETNKFEVGTRKGRLDLRGNCLLDDSGDYIGFKLKYNRASEEFGKLLLDFETDTARYLSDGVTLEGNYVYEYDESEHAYTGKYLFRSGENSFEFMLDEANSRFLKEGAEKGSFRKYNGREFSPEEQIVLDGFGGAEAMIGGTLLAGSYRGNGELGTEWLFEGENSTFRFVTSKRIFETGESMISEDAFLVYDEALAGSFEGSGALTLDGYGILGEYRSLNGEIFRGAFTREGNFVTLYSDAVLRFTLQGSRFSRTGEEAGTYQGDFGELLLDGAGMGTLKNSSGTTTEGSYRMLSEKEIEFTPLGGEKIRVRIGGSGYECFDGSLYGNFEGSYTARLFLDGYGGGVYTSIDSRESFPVTVGYFDGEFLEILSDKFEKPLNFQIGADRELYLLQGAAVGRYVLLSGEGDTEGYLLLYDRNYGKMLFGGKTMRGSYTLDSSHREITFSTDEGKEKFLIRENRGIAACIRFSGNEVYEGMGRLILDGYGHAVYENGESLSGSYVKSADGVKMTAERSVLCFTVEGGLIKEVIHYLRYFGESEELLLEKDGDRAVYQGIRGNYSSESFTVDGIIKFSFKLSGENFAFYHPEEEKCFEISGGGRLVTDGCGNGTLTRQDVTVTGKAWLQSDLILFSAETVNTLTKTRAFRIFENTIEPLGEEYGVYLGEGGELSLDGINRATFKGIEGTYRKFENADREYVFEAENFSFRFRILLKENATCFEIFSEQLEAQKGNYETSLGRLIVSGYGVELEGADGVKTQWRVIAKSEKAFVIETPQGARYLVSGNAVFVANERIEIV